MNVNLPVLKKVNWNKIQKKGIESTINKLRERINHY
jgi:hypothetical protein